MHDDRWIEGLTTIRRAKGTPAMRGRLLRTVLQVLITLRQGRWTIPELADELGILWRTAYRIIEAIRSTGIVIEKSVEHRHVYYRIPAESVRKVLHL